VVSPATAVSLRDSVHTGDAYRAECLRIAQAIPVAVSISGDRDGRLAAAFSDAFADAGFKTGGSNNRYILDGSIVMNEVALENQKNKFVRFVIDAKLRDVKTGTVILPFSLNGREGHVTISEAENRAMRTAEKKVREAFAPAFTAYLTQLSADKK